jgi:3-methyladenine DNA glycosylase AlkD
MTNVMNITDIMSNKEIASEIYKNLPERYACLDMRSNLWFERTLNGWVLIHKVTVYTLIYELLKTHITKKKFMKDRHEIYKELRVLYFKANGELTY